MSTAARTARPATGGVGYSVIPALGATYWTSIGLTVASAAASAFTLFMPSILHGEPVMIGSARGTALVALFVAIPILILSMVLTARGAVRPVIGWLGATAFLQYNSFLFLLATPFNSLFLFYIAMFAFGFWTLVLLLRAMDVASFAHRFDPQLPARAIAAYLGALAALNTAAWLAQVVPGLFATSPAFLEGTGLTTNPIFVQDLSFWLPLAAVTAVLMWRRQAWGFVLAGGMLVYFFIEAISVAVDQWMGSAADPASTVASATFAPVFGAIAIIGLIPAFFYFRHLNRS